MSRDVENKLIFVRTEELQVSFELWRRGNDDDGESGGLLLSSLDGSWLKL